MNAKKLAKRLKQNVLELTAATLIERCKTESTRRKTGNIIQLAKELKLNDDEMDDIISDCFTTCWNNSSFLDDLPEKDIIKVLAITMKSIWGFNKREAKQKAKELLTEDI